MKKIIMLLFMASQLTSCNSQKKPLDKAKKVAAAITQTRPGTMPATEGSWMMTASVNGKKWQATFLMPPEAAGRIVGYYNNEYIGLPYNKQYMKAGKKIILGPDEAADIFFTGVGLATTKTGEMEITKVNSEWAEGKFYFTSSINGTTKSVIITEGFFRISLKTAS